jgi:poly-gamma-glutamate capsule biosynthesis protein CapA/YwtB (metallophosphatase superfamily)
VPTTEERAGARADSARARSDSVRAANAARGTALRVARRAARPLARTDTLPTRELRAPVRVCAGGDVTLGTNLDTTWARKAAARMRTHFRRDDDPASLLAPLGPLVGSADVVLLNVESAIGEGRTPTKCGKRSTHCFAFRSPPASAPALRALAPGRVVVGNVANNHARDAGDAGRDSTIAALTRAGVLVTGADTLATPVRTPAGDTIGVLGFYTSSETPDARDTAAVHRHVARAAQQYPVVIATMHLGAEGRDAQRTSDTSERYLGIDRGNPVAFADAAVRGGAALVVGHGPHVLRAMEWRHRGALIAYSLGNLLTYGPFVLKEPLNRGAVLCALIDTEGRVSSASLGSTVQSAPGILQADRSHRAAAIADSLGRLDFPATGARASTAGVLEPRASP